MKKIRTENRQANAWRKVAVLSAIALLGANLCKAQNDNWADADNRDTGWPRWGTDTDGDVYYIHSSSNLAQFAWMVNDDGTTFDGKTVILMDDIDLSAFWWTPVGGNPSVSSAGEDPDIHFHNAFQGTFDGQGHTIRGLWFSPDHVAVAPMTAGLFGTVVGTAAGMNTVGDGNTASIRNLKLEVAAFESDSVFAGAVAGLVSHADVQNVSVSGAANVALWHGFVQDMVGNTINVAHGDSLYPIDTGAVGGLFGRAAACTLSNCVNALIVVAEVRGEDWENNEMLCVGGVAGYVDDVVADGCRNSGIVATTDAVPGLRAPSWIDEKNIHHSGGSDFMFFVGGLFGFGVANGVTPTLTASDCVNEGEVDTRGVLNYIVATGGIVGTIGLWEVEDGCATLVNCHNRANILGGRLVGGIAGFLSLYSKIRDCSNAGYAESSFYGGGIVGGLIGGEVKNCWNSGGVAGVKAGGVAGYFSGSQMENCYSSATDAEVTGTAPFPDLGALMGYLDTFYTGPILNGSVMYNCYWHESFGANFYGAGSLGMEFYCGTFGDPDPTQGGTVAFFDTTPSEGLLDTLNAWVAQNGGGGYQEWTLVDSYERGAKGYPTFGPMMPETPPDYDWYFVNDIGDFLFGPHSIITNAAGWKFDVQVLTTVPHLSISVISCFATPDNPAPLNFSGTRHSDVPGDEQLPPNYTFIFGAFGGGVNSILDGFEDSATSLVLPTQWAQYTIADNAFRSSSGLEGDLVIPDTVVSIGDFAFSLNSFTGSLTIPGSVVTIGYSAFDNCAFDGTLTLNNGIEIIGSYAFYNNAFEGSLVIPDSVVSIGDAAFSCCCFDGTLTLGDPTSSLLTSIGNYAFYINAFKGDLVIPDSVVSIDFLAFMDNLFGGELSFGSSASSLANMSWGAFRNCTFEDVSSWGSLTNIVDGMFEYATFTTNLFVIPTQIENIESGAFGITTFAGDVVVGDGVTNIGDWAFAESVFNRISLPSTGVNFGQRVFQNIASPSFKVYYRGDFPADPGETLYNNSLGATSYVTTAWVDDWNDNSLANSVVNGVDTTLGNIQSELALWHGRPILCGEWDVTPYIGGGGDPGDAETWVHVDVIRVSPGGDVDLEWAFADVQTRLGVTTDSEFHYVIEVCTDLTLMDWVTCASADLGRSFGNDSRRIFNNAMPVSDKRFFKVKAVKD